MDWRQISIDPNSMEAKVAIAAYLRRIRAIYRDRELIDLVCDFAQSKRVLDIGVVSHVRRYIDAPDWRHRKLKQAAAYILGIDILKDLIQQLIEENYNVRCADATSDEDLGERFDIVFIGDVIEHVENPGKLLSFAARHLEEGGRILVATPNAFSRKFFRQFLREDVVMTNLDHVAWYTPTMALELGRRQQLLLTRIYMAKKYSRFRRLMIRLTKKIFFLTPDDYSFPDYLYEFAHQPVAGRLE